MSGFQYEFHMVIGRNFIKFGVEVLGSSSKDEVSMWRMIVSSVATVMTNVFQKKKNYYFKTIGYNCENI